jgi:nitroreductase
MEPRLPNVAPVRPCVEAVLRRRSHRVFRPEPPRPDALDAIREAAERAPALSDPPSGRARLVSGPVADRLPGAITSGLLGKANPWVHTAKAAAYLVLEGNSAGGLRDGDRCWYNAEAAIAGERAVIEAAGRGVGSCWIAAFHEPSVARVVETPEGWRPIAVIPLGMPPLPEGDRGSLFGRGWDATTQRFISGKRKSFGTIASRGRFGVPFPADGVPPRRPRGVETTDPGLWPGTAPGAPAAALRGDPIPERDLAMLLECARWAPSAENSQIARHVVVEGAAVAELLRAAFPGTVADASPAPAAVLSLGAPFLVRARTREQPFLLIDVPIAVANLIAVAPDLGLGWQTALRFEHRAAARWAGAPDDHEAVAITLVGRPADAATTVPAPWDQLRPPASIGGR